MAEVEEKVGAIEAQCRLQVSDAKAIAAEAETKLAKHIKEAQDARAEISTLKDDLVKAAVLEAKLRAQIDDEQKQNRRLERQVDPCTDQFFLQRGRNESKATAAKMVEAELRDSLSTAQSRVNQLVLQVDTADSRARSTAAVAADELEVMTRGRWRQRILLLRRARTWNHYTWSSWSSSRKPTVMKLTNFIDGFKKALIVRLKQRPRWEEPGSPTPTVSKMDSMCLLSSLRQACHVRLICASSSRTCCREGGNRNSTEARASRAQLDSVRDMVASLQLGVQARDKATTEAMTPDGKGISGSLPAKTAPGTGGVQSDR